MQIAQWVFAAVFLGIGFLIALFRQSYKTNKADAQVLDLTAKINLNKTKLVDNQKSADSAVKEYKDALYKLDPDFHSDDDDSGGH